MPNEFVPVAQFQQKIAAAFPNRPDIQKAAIQQYVTQILPAWKDYYAKQGQNAAFGSSPAGVAEDYAKGLGMSGMDMLKGLGQTAVGAIKVATSDPYELGGNIARQGIALAKNKDKIVPAIEQSVVGPYQRAIEEGHPGEAMGRGVVAGLTGGATALGALETLGPLAAKVGETADLLSGATGVGEQAGNAISNLSAASREAMGSAAEKVAVNNAASQGIGQLAKAETNAKAASGMGKLAAAEQTYRAGGQPVDDIVGKLNNDQLQHVLDEGSLSPQGQAFIKQELDRRMQEGLPALQSMGGPVKLGESRSLEEIYNRNLTLYNNAKDVDTKQMLGKQLWVLQRRMSGEDPTKLPVAFQDSQEGASNLPKVESPVQENQEALRGNVEGQAKLPSPSVLQFTHFSASREPELAVSPLSGPVVKGGLASQLPDLKLGNPIGMGAPAVAPEAVDANQVLNLSKFQEGDKLVDAIKNMASKYGLFPKGFTPTKDIVEASRQVPAEHLDELASQFMNGERRFGNLSPQVTLAAGMHANTLADRLTKMVDEAALLPEEQREALQPGIDQLRDKMQALLGVTSRARSDYGLALKSAQIMVDKTADIGYWMKQAKKLARRELTPDEIDDVTTKVGQLRSAMQGFDQSRVGQARKQVLDAVTKLHKSTIPEVISAAYRSSLLSAPHILTKIAMANGVQLPMEEAARGLGSLADILVSRGFNTGRRTVLEPNARDFWEAAKTGAIAAVNEAKDLRANLAKLPDGEAALKGLDQPREIRTGVDWFDRAVNAPFRIHNATYQPFKQAAIKRSLIEQARIWARAASKLSSQDEEALLQHAMNDKELLKSFMPNALAAGEYANFMEKNGLSQAIKGARLFANPAIRLAMDLNIPFSQVPINIIRHRLQYMGVSAATKTVEALWGKALGQSMTPELQRELAMAWGRGAVGAPLMTLGWFLKKNGQMVGNEPPSARLQAEGATPGSVKIGGHWVQIADHPWGALMAVGASDLGQNLMDLGQTPLTDSAKFIASLSEAGSNPSRIPGMLLNRAEEIGSGFVPGLLADVAKGTDTLQRDTKGPFGQILNRIPGVRNTLPPKVDAMGREIPNDQTNALNPMPTSPAVQSDLFTELNRVQAPLSLTPRKIESYDGKPIELSAAKYTAFSKAAGPMVVVRLEQLVNTPDYTFATDAAKRKMIARTVSQARGETSEMLGLKFQ